MNFVSQTLQASERREEKSQQGGDAPKKFMTGKSLGLLLTC